MRSSGDEKGYIETTIEDWVRRNVAFPDPKLGRCTKIVLRHLSVTREPQGDVLITSPKLEDGVEEGINPLLRKIADAAQGDADDLKSGVQLYALYTYYENDRTYAPRKVFRVTHSDVEIERDVKPSEPATETGLVSQTMRHLEVVLRNQTIAAGQQIASQQAALDRATTMNEKLMENQLSIMVLAQDMLDNTHGRRLREKESEANLAMKESAMASLAPLLPVIVNRLAGSQILPEENKSLMLMAGLLENMKPEQQAAILSALSDSQRAVLAEIISTYEQQKTKYVEGQKKLIGQLRPNSQGDLTPPRKTPASIPLPATMTTSERAMLPDSGSKDPKILQLEQDAQRFAGNFRDLLSPNPEKKDEPR